MLRPPPHAVRQRLAPPDRAHTHFAVAAFVLIAPVRIEKHVDASGIWTVLLNSPAAGPTQRAEFLTGDPLVPRWQGFALSAAILAASRRVLGDVRGYAFEAVRRQLAM